MLIRRGVWAVLAMLGLCGAACGADGEAFTDAAKAGPDFAVQGEYSGELKLDGKQSPVGVQIIALGEGKFDLVLYHGGLPGVRWKRGDKQETANGKTESSTTTFKTANWIAHQSGDKIAVTNSGGDALGTLNKVMRKSPTEGLKAPEGAVVLFDGKNLDHWPGAKMVEENLLLAGATSKDEFRDFTLHIEFRTPFVPKARGQGRGNSGVYLQNRYECQVLDSFGLKGENNECGGFYQIKEPDVNMCYPPLSWQTYDVEFTGARFEGGKKTKNAKTLVKHNGVVIHDFELPKLTPGGANSEEPGKGPIALQAHGNPVVYRNIWAVEKK